MAGWIGVEIAAAILLAAAGLAGLRRIRCRRFRAAAHVGRLSRGAESLCFAALAALSVATLVAQLTPADLVRWVTRAAFGGAALALALWWVAERCDLRALPALFLAAAAALALTVVPAAGAAHAVALVAAALAGLELLRFSVRRDRPPTRGALPGAASAFRAKQTLKRDLFGRIEQGVVEDAAGPCDAVRRDFRAGASWLRPVAAVLARREATALFWLEGLARVPRLLDRSGGRFLRSWIDGLPLAEVRPRDPAYFAQARELLRRIHAAGVTHNDTHKVHNWLVTPEGGPALVDFQIAGCHGARTRWFRYCAREDLRHLLKHKRSFCPEALTRRERALLARRGWVSRGWLATVKPVYLQVTRGLLGWRDDEGRGGP